MYINGKDAYKTWGIYPEKGALSALMTPAPLKDYITNSVASDNGTSYAQAEIAMPMVAERTVTLPIVLTASSEELFYSRYSDFCKELQGGKLNIKTRYQSGVVYHCYYNSCTQFSVYNGTLAKFSLKMTEPNPANRTDDDND